MITVGGLAGTGTTTVCRTLAEELDLEHVHAGDLFRQMADDMGMDVVEFNIHSETHPEVDRDLDRMQVDLARQGGSVLEGRMSGYLAHREGLSSFNVWLTCSFDERVRRLSEREGGGPEVKASEMRVRESSERGRYIDLYGFDPADDGQLRTIFDMVIDTTSIPAEDVSAMIADAYGRWSDG